jgi:tetratricopeptide (TPR) repeat protein
MFLLYWRGAAVEMRDLAEKYRSAVEKNGTPMQRGKFFQMLALSYLTGSRYRPSAECLKLAELAVSESGGSSNLSETSHVRFVLGFIHLWRGNFARAVQECERSLQLAERVGDVVIQARSLTYLAVAYRRLGEVKEARRFAERALDLAGKVGMIEYVAMAKANLAWVALREGHDANAETMGREALVLWHGMEDPYGFDWMALWPLITLALKRKEDARAIDHARALLVETQHPLPDKLETMVRKALSEWDNKQAVAARRELEHALHLAQELGQL